MLESQVESEQDINELITEDLAKKLINQKVLIH